MDDSVLYKITYDIDIYSGSPYYGVKVDEYYNCKSTAKTIIVESESRRINKDKLDSIIEDEGNNTRGIRCYIYTLNKDNIEKYKIALRNNIIRQINIYKENITKLESGLRTEPLEQIKRNYY